MVDLQIPFPSGTCCGQPGSVFKSTDGGSSWSHIRYNLTGVSFDPMDGGGYSSSYIGLVVDPQNSDTVYLGTNGAGVFKSKDGGQSWIAASSGLRAVTANQIVIDPRNSVNLFAATGDRIFKSVNSGVNWMAGPWGVPDVGAVLLTVAPQTPDTMYMGSVGITDFQCGPIFKTIDGGVNWHDPYPNCWHIHGLTTDPFDPLTVYAAAQVPGKDGVMYKTSDGGGTWVALPVASGEAYAIAIDPKNPGTVYAGTYPGGYFTHTDGGATWNAASFPLYKSTDGGATWNAASGGLPPETIYLLAIDPQNTNTVYAASERGLYKSTGGGTSWSPASTGLRFSDLPYAASMRSLVIDPRNPSVLYAATDQGVFRSADGAANWSEVSDTSHLGTFSSLAIDPHDSTRLYAAGRGGIFVIDFPPESQPARRGHHSAFALRPSRH
jgi:photosystem II stability/assembly factor-like uncharacterized protein